MDKNFDVEKELFEYFQETLDQEAKIENFIDKKTGWIDPQLYGGYRFFKGLVFGIDKILKILKVEYSKSESGKIVITSWGILED